MYFKDAASSFGNYVDRLYQMLHRYWQLAFAVLPPLADFLSPTSVESFGQLPPVQTSSLLVHNLSLNRAIYREIVVILQPKCFKQR